MDKVELLVPAKNKQTAITAINSGADAIYIGAVKFGARQAVGNSLEDIKDVVEYAHKFYVKVHVTINTILTNQELVLAKDLIYKLYEIGVDAIIIQDMGILELAKNNELPPIVIHASTQCDNRSLDKVKFFDNIGVSRVILARELSVKQIKNICQNINAEVETFIHGALCVSYSGQCYMSHYIGGRSANRGECAQACRKKYSLIDEDGNVLVKNKYLLSLKDFNASKHLKTLINSGVKSFKIEGRLKDELYVKNVTSFYRKEIDKFAQKTSSGKIFIDFVPDVNKSFNRGFTDYFLDERKQCYNFTTPKSQGEYIGSVVKISKNYFEINSLKQLHPQDGLFFENDGCLINRIENTRIYPNKMPKIHVGTNVFRNYDAEFNKLLENSKIKRQIGVSIKVLGNCITVVDEDKNSITLPIPSKEKANDVKKMKENFIKQLEKTGESDFYIQNIEIADSVPFLPISAINELRRNLFENLMKERIKNYKRDIQKPLKYANFPQKEVDYKANIHNEKSKWFYEKCNCKVCEMSAESGSTPKELMRTKHCLKYAFDMCKSPKKLYLIDEKGVKYPLNFDCKNCEMSILNPNN